jgi:hypothetical protein
MQVIRQQTILTAPPVADRPGGLTAADVRAIGDDLVARTPPTAPVWVGHEGENEPDRGEFGRVANPSEHEHLDGRVDLVADLYLTDSVADQVRAGRLNALSAEINGPILLGVALLPPSQKPALGTFITAQPEPVDPSDPQTFAELAPSPPEPVLLQGPNRDIPVANWEFFNRYHG